MKVLLIHPNDDSPAHLHLEPQDSRDGMVLAKLVRHYRLLGLGRDPQTGAVIHVQVRIDEHERQMG